jgi:voltage-gated potassium channel
MSFELEPRLRPSDDDGWRLATFRVIFEHDTRGGWLFDVALIAAILASVLITMLDSVASLHASHGRLFYAMEWVFTLVFTVEYIARLLVVTQPLRYARSFFGIVDLLAVLPTWLSLLFPGSQYLLVVRLLRILRVFRILKLARYVSEAGLLVSALRRSSRKIFVFLFAILTVVTVFGALMYVVEGPAHGFDSIPLGIYWAIVTVGTVGFGDIAPATGFGRFLASILILFGYGLIAVPTGIYTAELAQGLFNRLDQRRCGQCGLAGHDADAGHCRNCGAALAPAPAVGADPAARHDR